MDFNRGLNQSYLNRSLSSYLNPSYSRPPYSLSSSQSALSRRVVSPTSRAPFKRPIPSTLSTSPLPTYETTTPVCFGLAEPPYELLPTPPSSAFKPHVEPDRPTPDSIFRELSYHILQHVVTERPEHRPLDLLYVSATDFESFLTHHGKAAILGGIKLEYDARARRIIMCPPPARYHDCTPDFLRSVITGLQTNPSFDTPARQQSLSVRETAFRSRDGSYLVPDAAVVVWPTDGEPREWPTIVVEVANSQGYEDVVAKVKRWFVKSHGKVEVALVLKFTAKDPVLDPACFLEVWRCRPVRADAERNETILFEMDSSDDSGAPALQGDIGSPVPDCELDPEGSDSSLSPVDEDMIEPECLIDSDPIIPAGSPSDSDSSLSSLDDEDLDVDSLLHTTLSSLSAATTSTSGSSSSGLSSASTSPFFPTPHHRMREIYLSGTRTTVLPVVDPESRTLTLRYSDFFGTENVPEGRDENEPVLLDLAELRREIALLMKVTIARAERAKKHAASGGGGGGKRVKR